MEKKKIILIIILFAISCVLGILLINKKTNDDEVIVQSNIRDKYADQLEIIADEINIRLSNDTKSEKIGKVVKGEIYTILESNSDNYYEWYHIKTNNDIEGFIAGKYTTEEGEIQEYIKILEKEEKEEETE